MKRRDFLKFSGATIVSTTVVLRVEDVSSQETTKRYVITGNADSVNWPDNVLWRTGREPVFSGGTDVVMMETFDGGKTWYADCVYDLQ